MFNSQRIFHIALIQYTQGSEMREPVANLIAPVGLQISVGVAQLNCPEETCSSPTMTTWVLFENRTWHLDKTMDDGEREREREREREGNLLSRSLLSIHRWRFHTGFLLHCYSWSLLGIVGQVGCPNGIKQLFTKPRWHTTRWWAFFQMKVGGKGPCFALEMLSSQAGFSSPTVRWLPFRTHS